MSLHGSGFHRTGKDNYTLLLSFLLLQGIGEPETTP